MELVTRPDANDARFKMGTLSRLTGLKPELLRAWQRRFALFEPERTEGGHRMYTPDDLRIALYVQRLLGDGRSIGEVASQGRPALLTEARAAIASPLGGRPAAALAPTQSLALGPSALAEITDRIVSAAVALEPEALAAALDEALDGSTTETFLTDVVTAASHRIGALWAQGTCSVAGEHLASAMIRERLLRLVRVGAPAAGGTAPEVVVACAPDELHENGALVTAVRLGLLGWRTTWLGAATPVPDLDKVCRTRRPHAVFVSVTGQDRFAASRDALLAFARRWRGAFELVIGGQGVPVSDGAFTDAGARMSPGWTPPGRPPGWESP